MCLISQFWSHINSPWTQLRLLFYLHYNSNSSCALPCFLPFLSFFPWILLQDIMLYENFGSHFALCDCNGEKEREVEWELVPEKSHQSPNRLSHWIDQYWGSLQRACRWGPLINPSCLSHISLFITFNEKMLKTIRQKICILHITYIMYNKILYMSFYVSSFWFFLCYLLSFEFEPFFEISQAIKKGWVQNVS